MIAILMEIIIGLGGGLAVGGGLVAFLTVLGVIPRLMQLSKTGYLSYYYQTVVVIGSLFGVFLSFEWFKFSFPEWMLSIWGFAHGIFVGMLAAALTEVLNVFPIITRRIGMEHKMLIFIMAIVFGKISGSLFHWLWFVE